MDVVTSESESESESEYNEQEWKQLEDDIHHLAALQTEACERMVALSHLLSSLEPDESVLSIIQQCHLDSLQELEETGDVSFGQRLLSELKGKDELKQD